ncbi:MAG TPA: hypothetical protein VJB57_16475, partial [Dehalococcoidia bacterium]|nr:hypothetical protein [Dehalococcoidia bacterium]
FCGRGTAPFQALLMNRRAIGNDINAVAYCVTKAKTNAPDLEHVEQRLDLLEAGFDMARWEDAASSHPEFFSYAFAPETFKQLLYLRDSLHWSASDLDCMIAAVVLGILSRRRQISFLFEQPDAKDYQHQAFLLHTLLEAT